MPIIRLAQTDADLMKCWPALKLLRPHLDESVFLSHIRSMLAEGYHLAFIETPDQNLAAAAVGFRTLRKLFDGQQIYVDDLTTLEEYRGKGYANALLDFVIGRAAAAGYACVTLDSGPHRHDAHRLYLNKGFQIGSYHFTRKIRGND